MENSIVAKFQRSRCCKCGMIESILCSFTSCKSDSWFLYRTVPVLKTAQDLSLGAIPHPRSSFAEVPGMETFEMSKQSFISLPTWSCSDKL